jgi:glutamyl-tRNA reductase
MHLLAIGLNHTTAALDTRDRLALTGDRLAPALSALREHAREGAILSTCNRTEVYALTGHQGTGTRSMLRFLTDQSGVPLAELEPHLYTYHQAEAARHLCRVAAGLDSMILGEPQILGQVVAAHEAALARGTAGPVLAHLFRTSIEAGKAARTNTAIARNAVSISHAAVELARGIFGGLRGRPVLVVGLGEIGVDAARNLADHGAAVTVINRTHERAVAWATANGATARPWADLPAALAAADIVLSGTAAPGPVIAAGLVEAAQRGRGGRPLLLIDQAVPRDIEPAAGRLANVFLYDLDGLQEICRANMAERGREIDKVDAIIADAVDRFMTWLEERQVAPTIAALREQAERIRQSELEKTLSRLSHLSERERNAIIAMSHGIVNKLLHTPSTRLKNTAGRSHAHALRELFALTDERDALTQEP